MATTFTKHDREGLAHLAASLEGLGRALSDLQVRDERRVWFNTNASFVTDMAVKAKECFGHAAEIERGEGG